MLHGQAVIKIKHIDFKLFLNDVPDFTVRQLFEQNIQISNYF